MKTANSTHTDFYWSLLRLTMTVKKRFIIAGEDVGLTGLQTVTLCMLRADQPCTMSSIAKIASCDPSNLTDAIEKLVKSGLVSREESPRDRRNKLLTLTTPGIQTRQQIFEAVAAAALLGDQSLTEPETAEMQRLLAKSFTNG